MLSDQQIESIKKIVSAKNLQYQRVAEKFDPGMNPNNLDAGVFVTPESTEHISKLVKLCTDQNISIVPQGGRTGLSGAAESSSGQLIIDTRKLNSIIDLDFVSGIAIVECGVTLESLQAELLEYGFGIGVDLAARGTATIGGMAATNAGGTAAFRFGTMRNRILGLEAVLPSAAVFSDLKSVTKANEGYDIKQLLIGSEGTLGIITKLVLNLVPIESNRATALVSCENATSAALVFQSLRASAKGRLLGAEVMWPDYANTTADQLGLSQLLDFSDSENDLYVILDLENDSADAEQFLEEHLSTLLNSGDITSALIAQNEREADDFWRIREQSFLCDEVYPNGFWYDVSVPLVHLDQYVEELFRAVKTFDNSLKVFLFGHLGDGNLHLTISSGKSIPEKRKEIDRIVYDGLNDIGGSFSAEHGIGTEKSSSLEQYSDPTKMAIMRSIKSVLDPKNIMNPGKVMTG